jgi:hypothetical protein
MSDPTPPEPVLRSSLRWMRIVVLLLIALAYANSFRAAFLLDDKYTIPLNPYLTGEKAVWYAPFVAPPGAPSAGRPMISLSFWLNWQVSGADTWSYHLANLFIHMGVALILFGLIRRLLARSPRWAGSADRLAFLITLLWAVHPIHTSAVTYVSQRAESIMALFFMGCLAAIERWDVRRDRRLWPVLAVVCAYLATLSKEVGAMLPFVVLLFDRAYLSPDWRTAWRRQRWVVLAMIPAILVLAALQMQDPRGNTVQWSYQGINSWTYLQSQAVGLSMYLWKMIWPHPLIMHYGWPVGFPPALWVPCFLFIGGLFAAAVWAMVRRPRLGFPGVAAFLMLGPSSSVVPVISEIWAEHRMYLPGAIVLLYVVLGGALLAARRGWDRHPGWIRGAKFALALFLVVAVSKIWLQNARYRNEVVMWQHNAKHVPHNRLAHYNLGCALAYLERLPEAAAAFQRSIQCSPDYGDAWGLLGVVYFRMGDVNRAIECSYKAVAYEKENPSHPVDLANHLLAAGRVDDCVAALREGLRMYAHPRWAEGAHKLRLALLEVLLKTGNLSQASAEASAWKGLPSSDPAVRRLLLDVARNANLPDVLKALESNP